MIRAQVFRLSKDLGSNPAQSTASFFPQKDFKFFKFQFNDELLNVNVEINSNVCIILINSNFNQSF